MQCLATLVRDMATSMSTNDSCSAAGILGIMESTENDYCGLSCRDVCFHGISLTGIVL